MLPKSTAEEMKLNKGTILKASCDYIKQLQRDRDIMIRQQQAQMIMEETSRRYMDRIKELEEHMEKHGLSGIFGIASVYILCSMNIIAVPPSDLPEISDVAGSPLYSNESPTRGQFFDSRAIKQEPIDVDCDSMMGRSSVEAASLLSPTHSTSGGGGGNGGGMTGFPMSQLQEMQITSPTQTQQQQQSGQMNNFGQSVNQHQHHLQQKLANQLLGVNVSSAGGTASFLASGSLPVDSYMSGMNGMMQQQHQGHQQQGLFQFSPNGVKMEGQSNNNWQGGGGMFRENGGVPAVQVLNGGYGNDSMMDEISALGVIS